MTKSKSKKLFGAFLAIIFIFSSCFIVGNAANTKDEPWTFIFSSAIKHTAARRKQNSTKIYFKVTSTYSGYSFTATPMGYAPGVGPGTDIYGYAALGPSRTISGTGTYYLANDIYQEGFTYAAVRGYSSSAFSANGVWSPDNSSGY